ncbi:MAG TPA: dihydropteroate synthase [Thermoanaerobaculia bacterium]|nr:dihydropteroate synthase [Thermoanaerobaculia bacterium]
MPTAEAQTRTQDAADRWSFALSGGRRLGLDPRPGRALVMGIVNVTPDSFSDGGLYADPRRAVEHALALAEAGADLLDLGAESTRPAGETYGKGAAAVDADEEWRRLEPVLVALREATPLPLSVDTRKGEVAQRALAAGADLVNDVTALSDPALAEAVAAAGCPVVLMHSRGDTATMKDRAVYRDVAAEVRDELAAALAGAEAAGIDRDRTILDPGLGFAKTAEQSLELLARLDLLAGLGRPLLVGASRKSFLGTASGVEAPAERVAGSLAAAVWAAERGAAMLRVHDVAETVQALAVLRALAAAEETA